MAAAALAHGLAIVALAWMWPSSPAAPAPPPEPVADLAPLAIAEVTLFDDAPPGAPLIAAAGDADRLGDGDTHPFPRAPLDAPGRRAAAAGQGAPGQDAHTGRRDADTRSAQIWNDATRVRAPRVDTGGPRRSDEAIARDPDHGFGDLRSRPGRARTGDDAPRPGSEGHATAPERDWLDADPFFAAAADARARRQPGALQAQRRPLVERGRRAVDSHHRGRVADDRDSAARSSELDPAAFERTAAGSGGLSGSGAGARHGQGMLPSTRGQGSAATTASARPGAANRALRATRQNPYFRAMYQRVDDAVRFPRERALGLDQGEVVVSFTLRGDGSLRDLEIDASSGFADFDAEAQRAFRAAAPFGAPPATLVGADGQVRVRAPYKFKNRLIR